MFRSIRNSLIWLSLLLLVACSSIPTHKPIAPTVSVAAVRPLNLSFVKQKLAFTLNVQNPNDYDLPLRGLDFIASFAGNEIAKGSSDEDVTLPAKGSAQMEVTVEASLNEVMNRFSSMLQSDSLDLNYGITGTVKLANWPTRIPFNVDGELEAPELKTGPAKQGEKI